MPGPRLPVRPRPGRRGSSTARAAALARPGRRASLRLRFLRRPRWSVVVRHPAALSSARIESHVHAGAVLHFHRTMVAPRPSLVARESAPAPRATTIFRRVERNVRVFSVVPTTAGGVAQPAVVSRPELVPFVPAARIERVVRVVRRRMRIGIGPGAPSSEPRATVLQAGADTTRRASQDRVGSGRAITPRRAPRDHGSSAPALARAAAFVAEPWPVAPRLLAGEAERHARRARTHTSGTSLVFRAAAPRTGTAGAHGPAAAATAASSAIAVERSAGTTSAASPASSSTRAAHAPFPFEPHHVERLAEDVLRRIERRMRIERERRGR